MDERTDGRMDGWMDGMCIRPFSCAPDFRHPGVWTRHKEDKSVFSGEQARFFRPAAKPASATRECAHPQPSPLLLLPPWCFRCRGMMLPLFFSLSLSPP